MNNDWVLFFISYEMKTNLWPWVYDIIYCLAKKKEVSGQLFG